MTHKGKIAAVVKSWQDRADKLKEQSAFCREHKFDTEAKILWDKAELIEQVCRDIRLKVIEGVLPV